MKRAFLSFASFIALAFLVLGIFLHQMSQTYMLGEAEAKVRRDLEVVAAISQGALAHHDYERIEEQVLLWGEEDPGIVTFLVTLEGDPPIIAYARDDLDVRAKDVLNVSRTATSVSGGQVTFEMTYDLSELRQAAQRFGIIFVSLALCVSVIFILSLWMLLKRLAIVPLQQDISGRKRAEEALWDSKDFVDQVINSLPDPVLVIDANREIVLANEAARDIQWNRGGATLNGSKCHEALCNRNAPCVAGECDCPVSQARGRRRPARQEQLRVGREGNEIPLDVIAVPVLSDDEEVTRVIVVARIVTDLRNAENERREMDARIQKLQKLESLGLLAGGIAHDFNNLLVAILGNADLALEDMRPESPARESVREIVRASRRAAELAQQMLAYSGKSKVIVEPLDLSKLVEEMVHMLEVSITKKAQLEYRLDHDLPAVEGDATQLRQVIMNLITNASEALGEHNGVISISTGTTLLEAAELKHSHPDDDLLPGPHVVLEVADTGCGMDTETIGRLFDPFFTTKFMGRGLGMAAVQGIARGHRGFIEVRSQEGKGTRMRLLLPTSGSAPVPSPLGASTTEDWQGSGTVLLVDDEESVRRTGEAMLKRLGMEVIVAADGQEAVDIYRERQGEIDCILLDLTMPRLGGEEVCRIIHAMDRDVQVVMMSGYSEDDLSPRITDMGFSGFIQKPFDMRSLTEGLRPIVGVTESRQPPALRP